MSVTLEASKLSGWLKADACCRVEGRACDAGGRGASQEARGPGVWWRHDKRHAREKAQLKAWGPRARAERTSNIWYISVTLEVSKLSGWLKALAYCRVEGRACDAGGEVRAGRREGLGCGGGTTSGMHGKRPNSRLGGQGHARGAHLEHLEHVRDAGGVEAQWLVEGMRVLPSRGEGMRCGGERCEPGGHRGGGGTQEACTGKRPDSRLWGQGHARSARRTCGSCQ